MTHRMRHPVPLHDFMPYGAPDLQAAARPDLARGLFAGTTLALALVAALALLRVCVPHAPALLPAFGPTTVEILPEFEPPPIPSILPPEPVAPVAHGAKVGGDVVPVVDERAEPDVVLPSQGELREADRGQGGGDTPLQAPPPEEPALPGVHDYVYAEELPVPVRQVLPEYPELARSVGVSGEVAVMALVGTDGRVVRASIEPHDSIPLLDDAALAAVRRWVFKPALANGHPVAVWVRVPVRFTMR